MPPLRQKPTPYYHMKICELAKDGWRKTKSGNYHGEDGTFFTKDGSVVFIGWSGSHIMVPQ